MAVAKLEDWEVIIEPGAVFIMESIHADGLAVELQVDRYEFAAGVMEVCAGVHDVRALLVSVDVSEQKADGYAPRIWAVMQDTLNRSSLPAPLPPRRLP